MITLSVYIYIWSLKYVNFQFQCSWLISAVLWNKRIELNWIELNFKFKTLKLNLKAQLNFNKGPN